MYVNGVRVADLATTQEKGILAGALWVVPAAGDGDPEVARGRQVFELACRGCHTLHGYKAMAPLVQDRPLAAIEATVRTLDVRRGRMPPFPGNPEEGRALARFLASLDGVLEPAAVVGADAAGRGKALMEEHCLSCHSLDQKDPPPLLPRLIGWTPEKAYESLGRLNKLNEEMPDFGGTDAERRVLADYLAGLAKPGAAKP